MQNGAFIQRLNAQTVEREGTIVTLTGGKTLKAIIHADDHALIAGLRNDGDAPEKPPVVFIFSGLAWGYVLEDMKVSIGEDVTLAGASKPVAMTRNFRVADPLHPKWNDGIVTELAVVAYPA